MSSTIPSAPSSASLPDETAAYCVATFREMTDLGSSPAGLAMSDEDVLAAPLSSFEIDSLTTLEFVMAMEDRFNVELDEAQVNRCGSLDDLASLVRKARGV